MASTPSNPRKLATINQIDRKSNQDLFGDFIQKRINEAVRTAVFRIKNKIKSLKQELILKDKEINTLKEHNGDPIYKTILESFAKARQLKKFDEDYWIDPNSNGIYMILEDENGKPELQRRKAIVEPGWGIPERLLRKKPLSSQQKFQSYQTQRPNTVSNAKPRSSVTLKPVTNAISIVNPVENVKPVTNAVSIVNPVTNAKTGSTVNPVSIVKPVSIGNVNSLPQAAEPQEKRKLVIRAVCPDDRNVVNSNFTRSWNAETTAMTTDDKMYQKARLKKPRYIRTNL